MVEIDEAMTRSSLGTGRRQKSPPLNRHDISRLRVLIDGTVEDVMTQSVLRQAKDLQSENPILAGLSPSRQGARAPYGGYLGLLYSRVSSLAIDRTNTATSSLLMNW